MGKIKDLPNHVSVLLLVEKWDKKWRLGRKKETERKKTLGAIWVRRCEQLLNVSHENVKRKKKVWTFFFTGGGSKQRRRLLLLFLHQSFDIIFRILSPARLHLFIPLASFFSPAVSTIKMSGRLWPGTYTKIFLLLRLTLEVPTRTICAKLIQVK